jgi:hypothetical protein
VVAELQLSNPAAVAAVDGELHFNKIFEGDAVRAGQARTARILSSNGSKVFSCDVGGESSDAVVKLTPTQINRGASVRIQSFRLLMP